MDRLPQSLAPLDSAPARVIVGWRYPPPYDIYNMLTNGEGLDELVRFLTDPQNRYYSIRTQTDELVGFCCFGLDAQVPGGDYSFDALDIGLGIRPDLTGQGRGVGYVLFVLGCAAHMFKPSYFRVTIAEFNKRALQVWEKLGFRRRQTFQRVSDGARFVMLWRENEEGDSYVWHRRVHAVR